MKKQKSGDFKFRLVQTAFYTRRNKSITITSYVLIRHNKFKVVRWPVKPLIQRNNYVFNTVLCCGNEGNFTLEILSVSIYSVFFFPLSYRRRRNGTLGDCSKLDLTLTITILVFNLLYVIQHLCGAIAFVKI